MRQSFTRDDVAQLFDKPFLDLMFEAQQVHRAHHEPGAVQLSQLISIKTGGCAEDCGYCSQSAKYAKDTGLKATKLMDLDAVLTDAKRAKSGGATRYCMGAAWTRPKDRDMGKICEMISEVKALGLETCATLGMLEDHQSIALKSAGLDYYNHNIDTSPEFYHHVITTREFSERIETLDSARAAGLKICCGGILGLGETRADRAEMLRQLAIMSPPPESVPINQLIPIPGTPLALEGDIDPIEFVRTIAVARILMPQTMVRLSAGRSDMSKELQAMCFMAGANSIFVSAKLLTADNPERDDDDALFADLGLTAMPADTDIDQAAAE
ncbi:MAG: biotin synthase BioB [Pseudomonadota bacterium]